MSDIGNKVKKVLNETDDHQKQSLALEAYEHVLNLSIALLQSNQTEITHTLKKLTTTIIALNK